MLVSKYSFSYLSIYQAGVPKPAAGGLDLCARSINWHVNLLGIQYLSSQFLVL